MSSNRALLWIVCCILAVQRSGCCTRGPQAGIEIKEIRTVIDNSKILGARFNYINMTPPYMYGEESLQSSWATIDLSTGRLSPGFPPNALFTTRPSEILDITAGYRVLVPPEETINGEQNNNLINFYHPDGSLVSSFEAPYDDYVSTETYFVSPKLQKAYLFLEQRQCFRHNITVAIVDLATSTTNFSVVPVSEHFDSFPIGFDCYLTGSPVESLYDDIQLMSLPGYDGICLRNTLVFFDETTVHFLTQQDIIYGWDLLDAIVYGKSNEVNGSDAHENSAFLVRHEYNWTEPCPYKWTEPYFEGFHFLCPMNYSLQEIVLSTGQVLRIIDLSTEDILSIHRNRSTTGISEEPTPVAPLEEPTSDPSAFTMVEPPSMQPEPTIGESSASILPDQATTEGPMQPSSTTPEPTSEQNVSGAVLCLRNKSPSFLSTLFGTIVLILFL